MGVAGPSLVKSTLGIDETKEEFGSARFQTTETRMADLACENDEACLTLRAVEVGARSSDPTMTGTVGNSSRRPKPPPTKLRPISRSDNRRISDRSTVHRPYPAVRLDRTQGRLLHEYACKTDR